MEIPNQIPSRLTLFPLIGAIFFMTSGGPYGLEELVRKAGYSNALVILLVTPLVWSVPTALMAAELSSALPADGGYYVWVRRGLGPFWGFQEAWLSLAASIFDMALYPTLFVLYLGRVWPAVADAGPGMVIYVGGALIAACAVWNIAGARRVGRASVAMMIALLAPFVALIVAATLRGPATAEVVTGPAAAMPALKLEKLDLAGGVLIAMWNYMGWDNSSTVAGEVERPQRTYPLALFGAVTLVTLNYVAPVAAVARTGIAPSAWTTGAWVDVGAAIGGPALAAAIAAGGMICGLGMMNALMLAYSRLPLALAQDGFLPAVLARRHATTGAPWVAILVCAAAWTTCLGLGFERLVTLDVVLFGLSLLLEFAALVALRIREPHLPRPFRVPGGTLVAAALGIGPLLLVAMALVHEGAGQSFGLVLLSAGIMAAGPLVYFARGRFGARREKG